MRRWFSLALLTGSALAAGSCRSPTEITLILSTDVKCADLHGTSVTVGHVGDVEARAATTTSATCDESGNLGALVVVPSGGTSDEVAIKVMAGLGRDVESCAPPYGKGCIVARRSLHYVPQTALRIAVPLRAVCDGIACDATQTCVGGGCAKAQVSDPAACAGGGCGEEALGSPTDAGLPPPDAAPTQDAAPTPDAATCGPFVYPAMSSFSDDFNRPDLGASWDLFGNTCSTDSGSEFVATPVASTVNSFCFPTTAGTYHLTCDSLTVKVPQVTAQILGMQTFIYLWAKTGEHLFLLQENGGFSLGTIVVPGNYDPVQDLWWRLREAGGELVFETSPDGVIWNTRARGPDPMPLDAVTVSLGAGEWAAIASPGTAHFDCLNMPAPCP